MKSTKRWIAELACSFVLSISLVQAAPNNISGTISGFTSVSVAAGVPTPGILVRISGGLPDNCIGTAYGWLLIPEANKAMMATALLAKATNKSVTVFTSGLNGGFCTVIQVQIDA